MLALQTRVETLSKACDATGIARPDDVISDIRVHYDYKGSVTKAESLSSYEGSTPKYTMTGETTVAYGRPTSVTDVYGKTTTMAYAPASGSTATKVTMTNTLGHTSTVEIGTGIGHAAFEAATYGPHKHTGIGTSLVLTDQRPRVQGDQHQPSTERVPRGDHRCLQVSTQSARVRQEPRITPGL
ncbi:hypothetical protein [Streptomyces sp. NPDC056296]|uniref:hypothetical protein n=1 Tax=Streptomyces sp. NPDC056296 TaxID=3345775 RepID=UPI0035DE92DE